MSRRAPVQPPRLPGYTHERVLGSGGYSDVHLYRQHVPRRQVAVKVLTTEATTGRSREQLLTEAHVMAQLATHSSIVAIYHADITADGRPFIVMQYCPLPNLSQRVKDRPLGVAEALGIAVRLAGAVETAHRAGIVHRDIKPANVLTTEYGRPALTDFGIAGVTTDAVEESAGVSIPWAPPEAVEGQGGVGVAGDVYSLAATVHTLLAGRPPFYRPGGPNGRLDYIDRTRRDPVPPLGREDVPAALERTLARAMSKDPARRHASALELGRALQVVEQELRLPMTELEVPDTSWLAEPSTDPAEERTAVRGVARVDPDPTPPTAADAATARAVEPTLGRPAAWAAEEDSVTALRPRTTAEAEPARPRGRRRRAAVVATLAALVVPGGVLGAGLLWAPQDEAAETPTGEAVALPDPVAPPEDLVARREGSTVTFSWQAPAGAAGEVRYVWQRTEPGADPAVHPTSEEEVTVEDAPAHVCLTVKTVAETGRTSPAAEACA